MTTRRQGPAAALPEPDSVCVPGPWRHSCVSTNGIHLHVADILPDNWEKTHTPGELPHLILFLHGYGDNWWAWHHQLAPLAAAGYHAIAVDLRGYGASDKPPRGYDLTTAANDLFGLVRATGHRTVSLVGHGIGGIIAWTMARLYPNGVDNLITVSSPHPVSQSAAFLPRLFTNPTYALPILGAQIPRLPEWRMVSDSWVETHLGKRTANDWIDTPDGQEAVTFFSNALHIPKVANCANEYLRWVGRSHFRSDGWRYSIKMRRRIAIDAVALRGEHDPIFTADDINASAHFVRHLSLVEIPNAGHYPQLEQPEAFTAALLSQLRPPRYNPRLIAPSPSCPTP